MKSHRIQPDQHSDSIVQPDRNIVVDEEVGAAIEY
jgi:hypothetical protein